MSKPEGASLIKQLLAKSDALIENFKVGSLAKFGLDYEFVQDNIVFSEKKGSRYAVETSGNTIISLSCIS